SRETDSSPSPRLTRWNSTSCRGPRAPQPRTCRRPEPDRAHSDEKRGGQKAAPLSHVRSGACWPSFTWTTPERARGAFDGVRKLSVEMLLEFLSAERDREMWASGDTIG